MGNGEKRYQIVKEALNQKEPMGQIVRRHQVSEALIYGWREKFFEGRSGSRGRKAVKKIARDIRE